LADARSVIAGIEEFKAPAKGMAAGLEAELSAVVHVGRWFVQLLQAQPPPSPLRTA
jgi:hypothetical protein